MAQQKYILNDFDPIIRARIKGRQNHQVYRRFVVQILESLPSPFTSEDVNATLRQFPVTRSRMARAAWNMYAAFKSLPPATITKSEILPVLPDDPKTQTIIIALRELHQICDITADEAQSMTARQLMHGESDAFGHVSFIQIELESNLVIRFDPASYVNLARVCASAFAQAISAHQMNDLHADLRVFQIDLDVAAPLANLRLPNRPRRNIRLCPTRLIRSLPVDANSLLLHTWLNQKEMK